MAGSIQARGLCRTLRPSARCHGRQHAVRPDSIIVACTSARSDTQYIDPLVCKGRRSLGHDPGVVCRGKILSIFREIGEMFLHYWQVGKLEGLLHHRIADEILIQVGNSEPTRIHPLQSPGCSGSDRSVHRQRKHGRVSTERSAGRRPTTTPSTDALIFRHHRCSSLLGSFL